MPRAATPRLVRPKEACTFDYDGDVVVLNPNELFDSDHPLVRARPALFMAVSASRPAVEQATAAPGEQRGA